MKIFSKLMILALIAGVVGIFFVKKPNGEPMFSINDFLPSFVTEMTKKPAPTLYRWQDEKGNWQYGDTPPDDQQASIMKTQTHINGMKTIDLPEGYQNQGRRQGVIVGEGSSDIRTQAERSNRHYASTKNESYDTSSTETGGESSVSSGNPLSKLPELLNDIGNIQESQENKQKMLESIR